MSTTLLNNIYYSSSLAETLSQLIKHEHKLTPAALARKLGIPTNKITRILNKDVTDPKASTLLDIANYFGITIEQLLGIEPMISEKMSEQLITTQALPIFEWSHPEQVTKEWYRWIPNDISGNYFALRLNTDLYEPIFQKNSLLIINREISPDDRSYLLIKKNDNPNCYLIKKYVEEGNQSYLYPINLKLPIEIFHINVYTIVGIILEVHQKLSTKK